MFIAINLINFIVDPFQHFRKAGFYRVSYDNDKARYIIGGLIKNYEYDCIVTGTSMVQNIVKNEVDSILKTDSLKVPLAGGTAHEFNLLMSYAIKQKKAKTIIYGLDIFSFSGTPSKFHRVSNFPVYLYEDGLIDDFKYLSDIRNLLYQSARILYANSTGSRSTDLNEAFSWHANLEFSKKQVLKEWESRKENFNTDYKSENYKFDTLKKSFDFNLLSLVQNNPKMHFIVFFPPYSILAWKDIEEKGWLEDAFMFKKYIFESTKELKNIKIYDFQSEKDITHSLDSYTDLTHYSHSINSFIIQSLTNDKYLLTDSNIDFYLNNLRNQVNKYKVE